MSKAIECIRLFSTMIDGGEKHSEQSRKIESQAIAELAKQPDLDTENIYKGESKVVARKLYNAYLSGRTKGFETGKRNADD